MEAEALESQVHRILREQRELPEHLDPDLPLTEYGIDSLDAINVLFGVEEEFGISIPDETARSIRTIRQMIEAIQVQQKAS